MNSSIKDFFTTSRLSTNIKNLGVKSVVAISSQVLDQSVPSVECSTRGKGGQLLGQLCNQPFKNWKHATEKFKLHESTNYHTNCILDFQSLSAVITGKTPSVHDQLNIASKQQKEDNRKIILPVIKSVILCGRQGISIRGHRDYGPLELNEPTENDGNFRAILRFYINATGISGDNSHILARENCKKNAQYISWKIQNQIVDACYTTADISGIEQFSLCARYFDSTDKIIHEDFLKFVPVHDVSGRALADTIINELKSLNIDIKHLRGQGYDGAATMSGKFNGVATLIKNKYPTALYIHCSSHNLNLSISYSCNLPQIRNTMGTIESIYLFFNTPKRQKFFTEQLEMFKKEESMKDDGCHSNKEKLKRLCPTRWVDRHSSVETIYDFLPVIVNSLEEMITWPDKDVATKANQILLTLGTSEFNIGLSVIIKLFQYTKPLSVYLQKKNIDLVEAINHINTILNELMNIRENAEIVFSDLFKNLIKRSNEMDIEIKIPRLAKRQKHRNNFSSENPEDYFSVSIFIPFIDSIIQQLNDRFNNHKEIISGFQVLINPCAKSDLHHLVKYYQEDVESYEKVVSEVDLWHRYLNKKNIKPQNALDALLICNQDFYPNIYNLLHILAVLPVTSCESERSFSSLKRIKTYLRNSTSETRLNGLAVLNIHREVPVTEDEVIEVLASIKRRLDFSL
ncbi:52 kDa repressor of the inhibitor of the protein kinase-like [Melanaphis sacchari]|uniref:52 kDa repressor of the inhibitor of the protein kinase-like n=1 Tax=Melanaphis sacchari TaxID=742174 RepID=UPI000DC15577|nr:52 kDa repressor of the inhibitor of the protein kinase-like [Melanaphis sacchari]